jgi:hypothetical protein
MYISFRSTKEFAVIVGLLLSVASTAFASVSCTITLSNSEGSTSEAVSVSNAKYDSVSVLLPSGYGAGLPYSIFSQGSGKSTSDSGKLSESISVNGGEKSGDINANVETRSGAFAWSKEVKMGPDPETSLAVISGVSNGNLIASYSNSNSKVEKEVQTQNSKYRDNTLITPSLVSTAGSGASQNEIGNGFKSLLTAENLDKKAVMNANLIERSADQGADNKWTDKIQLTPESASMDQSLTILSNNKCRLEYDQSSLGQILAGMTFTPYNRWTGSPIYETQKVPTGDQFPLSILIRPRMDEEPAYYDFKTLSMSSKWPS